MKDIVAKAIEQFYIKKDYDSFKEGCKKQLNLSQNLKKYINQNKLVLVEDVDNKDQPSKSWTIHFNDYKKGDFEVEYTTILKVSKVAPLFYVQHQFAVKHKNKDCTAPVLYGKSPMPHTKKQFLLHNEIFNFFDKKGYCRLELDDVNEVVEGFKIPKSITTLGPNVTVEHLLFLDIFDICSKQCLYF